MKRISLVIAATIALAACAANNNPCSDSRFDAGKAAFIQGDIAGAITAFYPLGEKGCAEAMHNVGVLLYTTKMALAADAEPQGRDLLIDSYMWLTLAARHHTPGAWRENSLLNRDNTAGQMTGGQIAVAERLALEWKIGQPLPGQTLN